MRSRIARETSARPMSLSAPRSVAAAPTVFRGFPVSACLRCPTCLLQVLKANRPKLFIGDIAVVVQQFRMHRAQACSVTLEHCRSVGGRHAHHSKSLKQQTSAQCRVNQREKGAKHGNQFSMFTNVNDFGVPAVIPVPANGTTTICC